MGCPPSWQSLRTPVSTVCPMGTINGYLRSQSVISTDFEVLHSFSFMDVNFMKLTFAIQAVEGNLIPDVAILLRAERIESRYYCSFSADED